MNTMILNCPDPGKYTNSVYKLPRTEQAVKYLYTRDGFLEKSEWLKAVMLGN